MNAICCATYSVYKLSSWYGTTFRKKSRKLFRGRDLILMKLKPHVSLAGSSTNSPFRVFLSTRGPKIAQAWQTSIAVKTLFECVYQIWGLYIIFKAMNADKWLWPIFGCKVGQSVQIGMKLELDVTPPTRCIYQVSNWYLTTCTKKVRKTFHWLGALVTSVFVHQRAKNCPTMTKISKDQDTHNISVCTKSEASIWFLRPWMQINDFDLFLAVK